VATLPMPFTQWNILPTLPSCCSHKRGLIQTPFTRSLALLPISPLCKLVIGWGVFVVPKVQYHIWLVTPILAYRNTTRHAVWSHVVYVQPRSLFSVSPDMTFDLRQKVYLRTRL